MRQRGEVYRWQLDSSRIIFVVVIFLVLVGIYFSWLQFRISLRPKPARVAADGASPGEAVAAAAMTEISASLEGGIKVSSPVLGVVILVISLLFFYLYLAYVYPITQNF
ncbi:MAG TPA: hypothetical protein VHR45_21410 [Thermoanaerobaculia bacterium]|nr:hypothetical protein [Thermoanaerobaculia bacterium]